MDARFVFLAFCASFLELANAQTTPQNAIENIQASGLPAIIWTTKSGANKTHTVDFLIGDPVLYLSQNSPDPTQQSIPLPNEFHVTQLGFDYHRSRGFWTEVGGTGYGRSIGYMYMNESLSNFNSMTSIIPNYFGISAHVGGIAVDWLANNVYWTDAAYNWIAVNPVSYTGKAGNDMMAVVVNDSVDEPGGIVVHPHKGLMFWTNVIGSEGRIERATLSGNHRRILVGSGLVKPWDITIDYETDTLYWADLSTGKIESINTEGENRRVVYEDSSAKFFGLVSYKDILIATDQNENALVILKKDQSSPMDSIRKIPVSGTPFDVQVYAKDIQNTTNSSCATSGCSDICVSEQDFSYVCFCKNGQQLESDGKECDDAKFTMPMFFFSAFDGIWKYPFNFPNRHPQQIIDHEAVDDYHSWTNFYNYVAMAIDTYGQTLFFADENWVISDINYWKLTDRRDRRFTTASKPEGLAVDWHASRLYWTDKDYGYLWCASTEGNNQMILLKDLQEPTALVVDPLQKSLYWIENSTNSLIYKADLDGQNKQTILDVGNGMIRDIYINYEDQRLYWVNSDLKVIMSAKRDGSDRQIVHENGGFGMWGITSFKDYIIWTDSTGVHSAHKSNYSREADEANHHNDRAGAIVTYDHSQQPQVTGVSPCDVDNGGCEDECFPTPQGHRCACKLGLVLQNDGTCAIADLLEDNFLLAADSYRRELLQFDLNGTFIGIVKVMDPHNFPSSVSYDPLRKQIYWADSSFDHNVIKRIDLDGSGEKVIFQPYWDAYFERIALDFTSGNLFYTDYYESTINVVTMASPHYHKVIINRLLSPTDIEVDPAEGRVYWTDAGWTESINRAYMDGTDETVIVQEDLYFPFGIALDLDNRKLYWVDGYYEVIERTNLDGKNRERLYLRNSSYFHGLAYSNNYLYLTDIFKHTLDRVDTTLPDSSKWASQNLTEPILARSYDVHVYMSTDRRANTTCSVKYGLCSHFCLPKERTHVCACPAGLLLKEDGVNCEGVLSCDVPNIKFGSLDDQCTYRGGESCVVTCDAGYKPTQAGVVVLCTNGTWNYSNWDYSCEEIPTHCSAPVIRNGVISPQCHLRVGEMCDVVCDLNHEASISKILCNTDVEWEADVNNVCNVTKCPTMAFKNGKFKGDCEAKAGSPCDIKCDTGYKAYPSTTKCLSSGMWDIELEKVCKDIAPPNMTCPDDMTVLAKPGQTSATIILPMPTDARDNSGGPVTFSYNHSVHRTMIEGEHELMVAAWDLLGNIKTCTFKVTVKVLHCPPIQIFSNSHQLITSSCPNFLEAKCFAECKEGYQMSGFLYYQCLLNTAKNDGEIDGSQKPSFMKSNGDCQEITTTTSKPSTTSVPFVLGPSGQSGSAAGANTGLIVGVIVAGVVGLALIICIAYLLYKRRTRNTEFAQFDGGSNVGYNLQSADVASPTAGIDNPSYDQPGDKKEPLYFNAEVLSPGIQNTQM